MLANFGHLSNTVKHCTYVYLFEHIYGCDEI